MEGNQLKDAKKFFSRLGLIFTIGFIIIFGIQSGVSFCVNQINPDIMADTNLSVVILMVPLFLIAYPAMLALINLLPKSEGIEPNSMKLGQFLLSFIIVYSLMYLGNIAGIIISGLLSVIKGSPIRAVDMEMVMGTNTLVQIIIISIIAPIFEELIFRKFLLDRVVGYGEGLSILLSGSLFALFHGNIKQACYAMLIGCFLAFIYVKTRKIQYCILLHMLINICGSVFASFILSLIHYNEMIELINAGRINEYLQLVQDNIVGFMIYGLYVVLLFGTVIAGIVLLIVFRKKFVLEIKEGNIPKGQRFKTVVFNPGMFICIVVFVGVVIYSTFV